MPKRLISEETDEVDSSSEDQVKKVQKSDDSDELDDAATIDRQRILDILEIKNIKTAKEEEFKEIFDNMANRLMNDVVLMVGGIPYVLVEIEYYFKGYNHVDHYAHGDEHQRRMASWYFHRQNGGGYKTASYKGLDITFGDGTAYAGILIRGIERVDAKTNLVDGPSLTVDNLLREAGEPDIQSFVTKYGTSLLPGENKGMYLTMRDHSSRKKPDVRKPISSGRVGLTMKMYKKDKEFYFGRDYRYIRLPDKVKKGKHYMNTALHKQGHKVAQIKDITKSTAAAIQKCIDAFEAGLKEAKDKSSLEPYKGALSNDDCCKLIGVCYGLEKLRSTGSPDKEKDDDNNDSSDGEGEESEEEQNDD
ncbi:hypothetical protein PPL_03225 [Heterostelium album PN500]|uniref:Uncharacterized protein n=1 Tax=Heterostelium pallidum (strain ATCC 26659 / Pp 5 / PN500) TaxID=670386 RepID=D3B4A3_HETP5|nr:hypothetical protein PPL_03225 [Heterostelium album PN500]EFA84151.1 hypothetical protein PPL_03225 [Heterostelium album PN500]|eukprot:XP_020436268.1 hypothetical protein PPL_03225 [Heterostelium album PN500]